MIRCRALGPVSLTLDDGPPPADLLWKKNLALLIYLARSPHRRRTRDHLIGLFWGDREASPARHSLREAIRVLRRSLGEGAVETIGDQVHLGEQGLELDTEQLERHASAGEWDHAAALVGEEFLEGFSVPDASAFEDWLAAERLFWRRRGCEALVRGAEARSAVGDVEAAVGMARRALQLDPRSERAVRLGMQGHGIAGDRAAGLALFDRFAAALGPGRPDAETRALAERLRQERHWKLPAYLATSAPDPGAGRRAPLVGATDPLATLTAEWKATTERGRCRLVVLAADPGLGKTRLGEELAVRASLDGAAVVRIRAVPADRVQPWSALVGLARGGLLDALGIGSAPPEALASLTQEVAEWMDRFGAAVKGVTPAPLARGFVEVLRAAATEQPLLLLVDDAEWLDPGSAETIEQVLRDLTRSPILLLLAIGEHSGAGWVDQLRARLGRDIEGAAVALHPLELEALTQLARWALPNFSQEEVARVARRVAADSAGIPLLAVELLHAIALGLDLGVAGRSWPAAERTLDQTMPGDLPDTVVAAIRVGARRLSKEAQAALSAAAVLGERTGAEAIGRGAGLAADALASALDELEWQRWLVAEARGYSFVARIVREVVARDLVSEGQRQRILETVR